MRILGIEFGAWSLKAIEMESRFRRLDVLEVHEIRLPIEIPDAVATYKKAMDELMARLPSHPDKIVTSLPPAQTALRFLQIPVKKRKKVEQMFKFELEDSLPMRLEDCLVEHQVWPTKDGSLVFVAAAPKKHVSAHLEWLRSIGSEPDWLTFEGMGIINLFLSSETMARTKEKPDSGPVLLLDIGHLKTNLALLHQGRLELFRSIAWGGLSITQSIAMSINLPLEEAQKLKETNLKLSGNFDSAPNSLRELAAAATQAFVSFFSDIQHSLVAFRSMYRKEIDSILVTGGSAAIPGIVDLVSESLGRPTQLFMPFKETKTEKSLGQAQELRLGETLGRAIVFARKASLLFNFRKESLAKGTSLTEITTFLKDPGMVRLARYLGGLALILFIHVIVSKPLAEKQSRERTDELKRVFQDTFRSAPSKLVMELTRNPQELKKFIDQKNVEMDQKVKMLAKKRVAMLGVMKSVSSSIPVDVKVDVNLFSVNDRDFQIQGVLYSGDIARITEGLKQVPFFSGVVLTQEGQRFTFRGEVKGR